MLRILNWTITQLIPSVFQRLDSLMITEGVSVLMFCLAVSVLVIVIGAVLMRV